MHKEKHHAYEKAKEMKDDEGTSQQSLDVFFKMNNSAKKYGSRNEMQLKIVNSLKENLIIGCGLPLSVVENECFRQFMNDVHPKFNMPFRPAITQKLIPAVKDKQIGQITEQLSVVKRVSFTVDIWTDRRMHSFLAITCHTFVNLCAESALLSISALSKGHILERALLQKSRKLLMNSSLEENWSMLSLTMLVT